MISNSSAMGESFQPERRRQRKNPQSTHNLIVAPVKISNTSSDEDRNSDPDAHDEHEYGSDDGSESPTEQNAEEISGDDEIPADQDHAQEDAQPSNHYSALQYPNSQDEESNASESSLARSVWISSTDSIHHQHDSGYQSDTEIKKNLDSKFSQHDHSSTRDMPGQDK